jgi:hypothetical protein
LGSIGLCLDAAGNVVRAPAASRVMQTFKAEGVLETRRGSIRVRNREALKIRAWLCNDSVKNHFEEVLRGVYPTIEAHSG